MKIVKTLYIAVMAIILLFIAIFVLLYLAGYQLNKEYFSYDEAVCLAAKESGINSCTFWMRANLLEKEQKWEDEFQTKLVGDGLADYCSEPEQRIMRFETCSSSSFKDLKRKENWPYLVSKEMDGFRTFCAEERGCKKPQLFK